MPPPFDEISRVVTEHEDELIEFRRDLHQHPELGRAEVRTTGLVAERLDKRIDDAFGPENGHMTKALARHFGELGRFMDATEDELAAERAVAKTTTGRACQQPDGTWTIVS